MSIKKYVMAILLSVIIGQVAMFAAIFYYMERRAAVRKVEGQQEDTLEKLRSVCQESVFRTSPFAAINFCNILAKDPLIRFAQCADFNARILAHTDPNRIGTYLEKNSPALVALTSFQTGKPGSVAHPEDRMIERFAPILANSRAAGAVSVGFNQEAAETQIDASLWDVLGRFLWAALGALVVGIFTALWVSRRLTGPIAGLVKGAQEVAGGRLDYKIPVQNGRGDELHFLIEEFNRMAGRLHQLDRLKEEFLASVTHDLKAPLTAIQGHAEMMMNANLDEKPARHLQTIHENAHRLGLFINDILDISRLEAGAIVLQKSSIDLAEVAASVAELFSAKAEEYRIRLDVQMPAGMPHADADPRLIHRVLSNLVSNALKFTPSMGNVTIRGKLPESHLDSGEARIEVLDSGPGIPQNRLDFVFEKFAQIQETRGAARNEGTGLGLAIAKQIVLAHGGRIWAENQQAGGARFIVTLPAAN